MLFKFTKYLPSFSKNKQQHEKDLFSIKDKITGFLEILDFLNSKTIMFHFCHKDSCNIYVDGKALCCGDGPMTRLILFNISQIPHSLLENDILQNNDIKFMSYSHFRNMVCSVMKSSNKNAMLLYFNEMNIAIKIFDELWKQSHELKNDVYAMKLEECLDQKTIVIPAGISYEEFMIKCNFGF